MIVAGLRAVLVANAGINALVDGRVWSKVARQGGALPHILLHRMSEDHNLTLGPTLDDSAELIFADIDIDCKANTPEEAATLAGLVKTLIDDYTGAMGDCTCEAVLLNDVSDDYEEPQNKGEQGRYVTTLDVQIQYRP